MSMMKIAIMGDGTLAQATREGCSGHFNIVAVNGGAEIIWCCWDTPIDPESDRPKVEWVMARIVEEVVAKVTKVGVRPLILISSQLPVGSTARLERAFPTSDFGCSPENLRVKTAVEDFKRQARVVVGVRDNRHHEPLGRLFGPFTNQLIFTDPETAECCKHFLNAWLALNIVFANEFARLCAVVGANADVVSLAIRTDARASLWAPLRPGAPYGGGHLEREIYNLNELAARHGIEVPVMAHIRQSNRVGLGASPRPASP